MLVDLSLGGLGGASSALATPTAHRLAQLDRLDTGCRRGPLGTKPLAPSEAVRVLWPQTHKTRHQATLLSAICLWAASAASTIAGDRIADPNATLPVNQPIARHVCFRSPSEARFNMGNLISHRRPHTIIHTASLGPKSGQPQRGGPGSHRCSPQAWPGRHPAWLQTPGRCPGLPRQNRFSSAGHAAVHLLLDAAGLCSGPAPPRRTRRHQTGLAICAHPPPISGGGWIRGRNQALNGGIVARTPQVRDTRACLILGSRARTRESRGSLPSGAFAPQCIFRSAEKCLQVAPHCHPFFSVLPLPVDYLLVASEHTLVFVQR